jgi:hypothetical protein
MALKLRLRPSLPVPYHACPIRSKLRHSGPVNMGSWRPAKKKTYHIINGWWFAQSQVRQSSVLAFADSPAEVDLECDRHLAKENSTREYIPDARGCGQRSL